MKMAEVIARKLVENGQEKILQRIFDGVNSNFVLDSFDFKESHHHQLLHLVWRRFPRNGCPTGGQKTTISDSTQTDEGLRPGVLKISKNTFTSDKDCFSASNMEGLSDENDSAPSSHSGSTSDGSLHSMDLAALEGVFFKSPAKGQSSKLKTEITKSQINLSNRFECLKDYPRQMMILRN